MTKNSNRLYIERRPQGDYALTWGGAKRASGVCDTQREAIERARELEPEAVMVERVRDTSKGARDKWRKP